MKSIYKYNYAKVDVVIDKSVRGLCKKPYYNHPKGCPNFNKRDDCPSKIQTIEKMIDIEKPIFAIWNIFDFKEHTDRMRIKHPKWSDRQVECCLYWQGTARKQLRSAIKRFLEDKGYNCKILTTPEACGVNLTATMKNLGIILEWPPVKNAYQIVLAGKSL